MGRIKQGQEKKSIRMNICIEPSLYEKLQNLAADDCMPLAEYLRLLIKRELNEI